MIRKVAQPWSQDDQYRPLSILYGNGAVVSVLGHVLQPAAPVGQPRPDIAIARDVALRSLGLFAAQPGSEAPLGLALDAKTPGARSEAQQALLRHLRGCLADPGMGHGTPPEFSQSNPFYPCQIQREASEGLLAALEARAVTLLRDGEPPLILLHHAMGFGDTLLLAQLCLADAVVAYAAQIGLRLAPGDAAARLVRQIGGVSGINDDIIAPKQFGWRIGREAWKGLART